MTTRLDPNVAYAKFTQHVARCADCEALSPGLCDAARQFLHAWGESEKAEQRLAETDVFVDCADDEYVAHPEDRLEAEA